ncbi:hypothetical protein M2137_002218 [Parabacteroides sp. PFB2-10]|uniref:T9SS type B sorting domain-containing protein n=1 Tax=Parabacteroides sp. PFB2-10 TaxID=1742405 RepID=UPI002475701D|nr:gliding motility-associated C-terminal domain-containing protein [Parabacteroides sp. PFB2-10]MDH6313428.1 hypothetical protein [Parabacteroides sp. PFB2-10]
MVLRRTLTLKANKAHMRMKEYRKWTTMVCFLLIAWGLSAQYAVQGGKGSPLMAKNDTSNDIQVWMVYSMEGVEISYTSSSASHQWYRYKTKALEAEPVNSTQQGNTSVITNLEEGWGYYVDDPGTMKKYVWLIDYSRYEFTLDALIVTGGVDPCRNISLNTTTEVPLMAYTTPTGGRQWLDRSFDISYQTLQWDGGSKMFSHRLVDTTVVNSVPFPITLKAPLVDTDYVLRGDQYARHFDREKQMHSEVYTTVAVEAHADTTLIVDPFSTGGSGLSAPATILFRGYANEPVAAGYTWIIYRADDTNGAENPLVRYRGEEMEYTFTQAGRYMVELEVVDRQVACINKEVSFDIQISDSYLTVPNAFSPGTTPGINDIFKVSYRSLIRFNGWIYNRWGVEQFRWSDPSQGWDGKKGGKYVPPGVYFYVIEAEGSDGIKYKRAGDINILRSKTTQE